MIDAGSHFTSYICHEIWLFPATSSSPAVPDKSRGVVHTFTPRRCQNDAITDTSISGSKNKVNAAHFLEYLWRSMDTIAPSTAHWFTDILSSNIQ